VWEQYRRQDRHTQKSKEKETTHSNFPQPVKATWKLLGPLAIGGEDEGLI
jgi:hypothetical protein